MTDLLLGGYGIKDIHKMPQATNKIDAIVESLNKSSEIGSAEVYIETMESNIRNNIRDSHLNNNFMRQLRRQLHKNQKCPVTA